MAKPLESEMAQLLAIWDIESLNVLRGYEVYSILPNIIKWLNSLKYQGVFEIEAVVAEYTEDRVPCRIRTLLESLGVRFTAVGKIGEDVADSEISRRIRAWSKKCQRGLVVVITCDGDYSGVLQQIQTKYIHTRVVYLPSSLRTRVKVYSSTAGTHTWNEVFNAGALPESLIRIPGSPVSSAVSNIIWAGTKTDWSVGRGFDVGHWLTYLVNGKRVVEKGQGQRGGGQGGGGQEGGQRQGGQELGGLGGLEGLGGRGGHRPVS